MNIELKKGDNLAFITAHIYTVADFHSLTRPKLHEVKVRNEDCGWKFKVISINKKIKYQADSTDTTYKLIDKDLIGKIIPCNLLTFRRKIITWDQPECIKLAKIEMARHVEDTRIKAINELKQTLAQLESGEL